MHIVTCQRSIIINLVAQSAQSKDLQRSPPAPLVDCSQPPGTTQTLRRVWGFEVRPTACREYPELGRRKTQTLTAEPMQAAGRNGDDNRMTIMAIMIVRNSAEVCV